MRHHPKFTSESWDDNDGVNYSAHMRVIKFMILVLFMTLTTVGFFCVCAVDIRCVRPSGDKLLICTASRSRSISKSYIGASIARIGVVSVLSAHALSPYMVLVAPLSGGGGHDVGRRQKN